MRAALIERGVSTVRVCDAINSALGALEIEKRKVSLGAGSITKRNYSVTETEARKYGGARNVCLDFDAFNGMVEKLEKKFPTFSLTIPEQFHSWLDKMLEVKPAEVETAASVEMS